MQHDSGAMATPTTAKRARSVSPWEEGPSKRPHAAGARRASLATDPGVALTNYGNQGDAQARKIGNTRVPLQSNASSQKGEAWSEYPHGAAAAATAAYRSLVLDSRPSASRASSTDSFVQRTSRLQLLDDQGQSTADDQSTYLRSAARLSPGFGRAGDDLVGDAGMEVDDGIGRSMPDAHQLHHCDCHQPYIAPSMSFAAAYSARSRNADSHEFSQLPHDSSATGAARRDSQLGFSSRKPQFSMGYRKDCQQCQLKVQGHTVHISLK